MENNIIKVNFKEKNKELKPISKIKIFLISFVLGLAALSYIFSCLYVVHNFL